MNYEYTTAFLLGLDARRFLDQPVSETVETVLDLLGNPESETIGIVAREKSGASSTIMSGSTSSSASAGSVSESAYDSLQD